MKIIRKHQVGGAIYTPFIYQPQEQNFGGYPEKDEKSTSPEKISGTMTKEIIDVLKENGIPNDVNLFLSQANSFLKKSQSLSDMVMFGGKEKEYDISDLVKIHSMANKVKFNKELYDNASARLTKENS